MYLQSTDYVECEHAYGCLWEVSVLGDERLQVSARTVFQNQPQVVLCLVPVMELHNVRTTQTMHYLNIVHDLCKVIHMSRNITYCIVAHILHHILVYSLDSNVLNAFFLPSLHNFSNIVIKK